MGHIRDGQQLRPRRPGSGRPERSRLRLPVGGEAHRSISARPRLPGQLGTAALGGAVRPGVIAEPAAGPVFVITIGERVAERAAEPSRCIRYADAEFLPFIGQSAAQPVDIVIESVAEHVAEPEPDAQARPRPLLRPRARTARATRTVAPITTSPSSTAIRTTCSRINTIPVPPLRFAPTGMLISRYRPPVSTYLTMARRALTLRSTRDAIGVTARRIAVCRWQFHR